MMAVAALWPPSRPVQRRAAESFEQSQPDTFLKNGGENEVCVDARPHLNPLPRGEDFFAATLAMIRLIIAPIHPRVFSRRGNNFPLSWGREPG